MHYENLKQLRLFKECHIPKCATVLEVGSRDAGNGSVRSVFADCKSYTGVDIEPGRGVDRIIPEDGHWTFPERFDLVISCNCLEHCEDPFALMDTMCRHVVDWGYIFLAAPFSHVQHRHPLDCYRFAPDGFSHMLRRNKFSVLESYLVRTSLLVPPGYLKNPKTFAQHCHGVLKYAWLFVTRRNVPHVDCYAVGRKVP